MVRRRKDPFRLASPVVLLRALTQGSPSKVGGSSLPVRTVPAKGRLDVYEVDRVKVLP